MSRRVPRCFAIASMRVRVDAAVVRAGDDAGRSPTDTVPGRGSASRAADAFRKDRSPEAARLQLEIDAARCIDPTLSPAAAHAIGTVNADLARPGARLRRRHALARRVSRRPRRSPEEARRLARRPRRSRTRCCAATPTATSSRTAIDQCPKTPAGAPTDARGCPVRVPPSADDHARGARAARDAGGGAHPVQHARATTRRARASRRRSNGDAASRRRPASTASTSPIAKVGGQPPGCEVFYEIQLRFIDPNPGNPALPPAKIVTIVFSASEDLLERSGARGLRPARRHDGAVARPQRRSRGVPARVLPRELARARGERRQPGVAVEPVRHARSGAGAA